jgi:primosomal protein N''
MSTSWVVLYLVLVIPLLIAAILCLKSAHKGTSRMTQEVGEEHNHYLAKAKSSVIAARAKSLTANKRHRPTRFDPVARNLQFKRDQAWRDYERRYNAWVNLNSNRPNPPPPPSRPRGM